jgi:voltage-gated potassium channel
VFAVFVVLLGFALFSLVTASIAAFFVGEDERQMRHDLHRDIKALHNEVVALRAQINRETVQNKTPEP